MIIFRLAQRDDHLVFERLPPAPVIGSRAVMSSSSKYLVAKWQLLPMLRKFWICSASLNDGGSITSMPPINVNMVVIEDVHAIMNTLSFLLYCSLWILNLSGLIYIAMIATCQLLHSYSGPPWLPWREDMWEGWGWMSGQKWHGGCATKKMKFWHSALICNSLLFCKGQNAYSNPFQKRLLWKGTSRMGYGKW